MSLYINEHHNEEHLMILLKEKARGLLAYYKNLEKEEVDRFMENVKESCVIYSANKSYNIYGADNFY
jgi:hypothetical protein